MFVNFSESARRIICRAQKEKEELNHPYVGSEHLFLSILKEEKLNKIFKKHNLTYKKFKDKLISLVGVGSKKSSFTLYTPLLKRIIEDSVIEAREENSKNVSDNILILTILNQEDGVAYSILKSLKINIDKLYFDIRNKKDNKNSRKKRLLLEELGVDLIKLAKEKSLDPVIGRDIEIKKTVEILLRRKKNNPLLIGPAGVGKTAIVEGIANLMITDYCPNYLKDKKIIALNIFELVSGTKYRGEFEEKMKTLIKELEENKNIILFIDEVHTIVGAGGAEGAIDASNIFKPALARGNIKIIGATTIEEYKKFIEPDAALSRRFQSVMIEEPNKTSVIEILTKTKYLYEKYHNVLIKDELIKEIVNLSEKYLSNRFEPDRSIDILDEVCARVSAKESKNEKRRKDIFKKLDKIKEDKITALSKEDFKNAYLFKKEENKLYNYLKDIKDDKKEVLLEDVYEVIKTKGNISKVMMQDKVNDFYANLEINLKESIFGQDNQIKKIIRSLKKSELLNKKIPYSLLINGKKDSGKNFLAKILLKNIVNEKNIIMIDAKEYMDSHTISKLIGTTAGYLGYDNKTNIFEKIRTNPSSGVIVKNFEDGCHEFKNIFERILELGYIEDASGKKIDFSCAVMIFITDTLNEENTVGFNNFNNITNDELQDKVSLCINVDALKKEDLSKIIDKKLKELKQKYKQININYDKDTKKYVLNKLNNKGLSYLNKIIEDEFETKIVDAILDSNEKIEIKINEESIV